jgi:hypothetical protein
VGRFYCDDVINGTPVKVRYEWSDTTTDTPKWNRAFSYEAVRPGGSTGTTGLLDCPTRNAG